MIQFSQGLYGKRSVGFYRRELHHLVNSFRGNGEYNLTTWGYDGSLVWNITNLAYSNKFRGVKGLRKI